MPSSNQRERMCAVTRQVKPVEELIRFVQNPEGEVVPDPKGELPGRGIWVTSIRSTIEKAIKDQVFVRGFKSNVIINNNLLDQIDKLLEAFAISYLGLARKAGQVVSGFTKVISAIRAGAVCGIIHASDASEEGLRKIFNSIFSQSGKSINVPVIRLFTSNQLASIFGDDNVVNVALLNGQVSNAVIARVQKLAQFREETYYVEPNQYR